MLARTLSVATALILAPAAGAATPRDSYDTHRLRAIGPVAGLSGETFEATASLVAPASWKRLGTSRSRLRLRAPGTELCTWTFTFSTRVFLGADAPAAEVAARRAPGSGPYVLDAGTRGNQAAWRVVRLQAETTLRGTRVDGLTVSADDRPPRGQRLWREMTAHATPGAEDECHMGTYSQFAGPRMGDILAVAKGRAFV